MDLGIAGKYASAIIAVAIGKPETFYATEIDQCKQILTFVKEKNAVVAKSLIKKVFIKAKLKNHTDDDLEMVYQQIEDKLKV